MHDEQKCYCRRKYALYAHIEYEQWDYNVTNFNLQHDHVFSIGAINQCEDCPLFFLEKDINNMGSSNMCMA